MSERSDNDARRLCPDGGACHHGCEVGCYRVGACEPLSGVYEGDRWPESVKDAERIFAELRRWLAAECETTMDEHRNFHSDYDEGRFDALEAVEARLDELAGAASAEAVARLETGQSESGAG